MKKFKCHCGEIEAEINISDKLEKILRCNCSICKRKGAIMSLVKNEDFRVIKVIKKFTMYINLDFNPLFIALKYITLFTIIIDQEKLL